MGVSMTKSDQSSAELTDSDQLYDDVNESKEEIKGTNCAQKVEIDKESLSSSSEPQSPDPEPEAAKQQTDVIQILCSTDDDDANEVDEPKDIYQRLKTNRHSDLQNANSRFSNNKGEKNNTLKVSGPVFTSTLAERPTRINSANFSPHAVTNDNDIKIPKVVNISNDLKQNEDNAHVVNGIAENTTVVIVEHSNENSLTDTKTTNSYESITESELADKTKEEIDELLGFTGGVTISECDRALLTAEHKTNNYLSIPYISEGIQSPIPGSKADMNDTVSLEPLEGLTIPRERHNSIGNISLYSVKDVSGDSYWDYINEIRNCIARQGFFDKFPTPMLVSDAQASYRKLDLPPPLDDSGSIPPHPPKTSKQEVFTIQTAGFSAIDLRILNAPQDLVLDGNTQEVVKYLCNNLDDNVSKIRAISTWLAVRQLQIADQKRASDTPESWCRTFRTMCRFCKIRTKLIKGIIRGPKYLPGDDIEKHRGIWVAALISGTWWLVDPVSNKTISDDFADTVNKNLAVPTATPASQSLFRHAESFFSDPEQFIFTHYPDEEQWQLLARPIAMEELSELAVLRHGYSALGMRLTNQFKSVIMVDKEEVLVSLGYPEQNLCQFMCKLYHSGSSGLETEVGISRSASVQLRRYLFTETVLNKHQVNIKLHFPKKGIYVLDVYGCSESQPWQKVVTYKLVYQYHIVSSPFPTSIRDEWGPGADAHALGLTPLSHHTGELLIDTTVTQVVFKDKKGLQFKHEVFKDKKKMETEQIKLSFLRDKNNEVVFVIDMEPKLTGTYTLQLSARSDTSKPFNNFCNYLIKKVECKKLNNSEKKSTTPRFEFSNSKPIEIIVHQVPDTGRLLLEVDALDVTELHVDFKHQDKQELNFVEHARYWMKDDLAYIDLNFPRKGKYSVKVQCKTVKDSRLMTVHEELFQADIPSKKWSPFPRLETNWESSFRIETPLNLHLNEKESTAFAVHLKHAQDVAVVATGGWFHLDHIEGGLWKGQVMTGPRSTKCKLMARFEVGAEYFSDLLSFKVMSKEDIKNMEDRQATIRENAIKVRREP